MYCYSINSKKKLILILIDHCGENWNQKRKKRKKKRRRRRKIRYVTDYVSVILLTFVMKISICLFCN